MARRKKKVREKRRLGFIIIRKEEME